MRKTSLILFTLLGAACAQSKDDAKGAVDDSLPPEVPSELGKADGSGREVAVDVQSAHPYTNNLDRAYAVPLTNLPSCASSARLHFSVLRTEPGYDFVVVEPTGAPSQSFDGNRDGTWTEVFPISGDHVDVRLDTDGSITRHGFAVDKLEWNGSVICPAIAWPQCGAGTVDVRKPTAVCGCPQAPVCAPVDQMRVSHQTHNGRNLIVHATTGTVAKETHPGPTDAPVTTTIGSVDPTRLADLLHGAAASGLLTTPSYTHAVPTGTAEDTVHIVAGTFDVTFIAGEGSHDAKVAQFITDFEALFACDDGGGLSCGTGMTCTNNECVVEQGCVCPQVFTPVCGSNGHTYGNACTAGCANVPVAHDGECGQAGDTCGTLFGLVCSDDNKCRFGVSKFEYPFPDAGGTCVASTYCDAPTDCNGLVHPAVVGAWQCNANACEYKAGAQWQPFAAGAFESAHPYAASTSVWKDVYLPANAQALRLKTTSFKLESNYDFLEVWSWVNGAWKLDRRYTGAVGPSATDEFPSRYHYLRFVSDSSINDQGFKVSAEWR